jgi:hypothetical protein
MYPIEWKSAVKLAAKKIYFLELFYSEDKSRIFFRNLAIYQISKCISPGIIKLRLVHVKT